jgi:hypothetical protein
VHIEAFGLVVEGLFTLYTVATPFRFFTLMLIQEQGVSSTWAA